MPHHVLTAVAWAIASVLVTVPLAAPGGPLAQEAAHAGDDLRVTGDVAGLVPGTPSPLVLTVANDGAAAVVVRVLQVEVSGGPAGCALEVADWHGRLDVPAGGVATGVLSALARPGTGCDGVRWELAYSART